MKKQIHALNIIQPSLPSFQLKHNVWNRWASPLHLSPVQGGFWNCLRPPQKTSHPWRPCGHWPGRESHHRSCGHSGIGFGLRTSPNSAANKLDSYPCDGTICDGLPMLLELLRALTCFTISATKCRSWLHTVLCLCVCVFACICAQPWQDQLLWSWFTSFVSFHQRWGPHHWWVLPRNQWWVSHRHVCPILRWFVPPPQRHGKMKELPVMYAKMSRWHGQTKIKPYKMKGNKHPL